MSGFQNFPTSRFFCLLQLELTLVKDLVEKMPRPFDGTFRISNLNKLLNKPKKLFLFTINAILRTKNPGNGGWSFVDEKFIWVGERREASFVDKKSTVILTKIIYPVFHLKLWFI